MKNNLLIHYPNLTQFRKLYFEGVLGTEHLESGKKHYPKLFDIAGGIEWEPEGGFQGYILERDSIKYLIDLKDAFPAEVLPIKVLKEPQEVAFRNDVYQLINTWASVTFKSEKRMSFRDLVDQLTATKHSNPNHQKLAMFLALCSYLDRLTFRICSPPSFGKGSSLRTINSLVGGCVLVAGPTLAKLEYRTNSSWLALDEMMELEPAKWKIVEQYILTTADDSPDLEKHSLGKHNGGLDNFDLTSFSLSVFYNDIDSYPSADYFDFRAHQAVRDRLVPFRLYGNYLEDWSVSKRQDNKSFVTKNMQQYKDLVYTITYFKEFMYDELHGYNTALLNQVIPGIEKRGRWYGKLITLLKVVDLYCESQDEFNAWIIIIAQSMQDYQDMLTYKTVSEAIEKKLGPIKWQEKKEKIALLDTYTERLKALKAPNNKMQKDLTQW